MTLWYALRVPVPMVEAVHTNLGVLPDMTLADAGYASEANFLALEARDAPACIALSREGKRQHCRDPEHHPATQRMVERLTTAEGKDHYRRKFIPEPVFSWIKEAMGFRCFRLRGLAQVSGEWNLACLALNLRRMHRLGWVPG